MATSPKKSKGKSSGGKREIKKGTRQIQNPFRREMAGAVCFFLGLFAVFGFFETNALFIQFFATFLKGTLGVGFWLASPVLLLSSFILIFHRNRPVRIRLICALLIPLSFSCTCYGFIPESSRLSLASVGGLWNQGIALQGCGVFGSILGGISTIAFSGVGTVLIFAVISFFLGLGAINRSMMDIVDWYTSRPRYASEEEEEEEVLEVAPSEEKSKKKRKEKKSFRSKGKKKEKNKEEAPPDQQPIALQEKETVVISETPSKKKANPLQKLNTAPQVHIPLGEEPTIAPPPSVPPTPVIQRGNPAPPPTPLEALPLSLEKQSFGEAFATGEDLKVRPSALEELSPFVEGEKVPDTLDILPKSSGLGFFNKKKKVPTPDEFMEKETTPLFQKPAKEEEKEEIEQTNSVKLQKTQEESSLVTSSRFLEDVEMEQAPPPTDEDAPPLVTLPMVDLEVESVSLMAKSVKGSPVRSVDASEVLQEHPIFKPLPSLTKENGSTVELVLPAPNPAVSALSKGAEVSQENPAPVKVVSAVPPVVPLPSGSDTLSQTADSTIPPFRPWRQ